VESERAAEEAMLKKLLEKYNRKKFPQKKYITVEYEVGR
jgi:hypothetical protein